MRVYLIGPMRGIPLYNFPAFHRAAKRWRARGYEVICPAEEDEKEGFDPHDEVTPEQVQHFFQRDIAQLTTCKAIALLPGWRESELGMVEYRVAQACGMVAYDAETMEEIRPETVLEEAARITSGDRNRRYGNPADNHQCTAEFWSSYLWRKFGVRLALGVRDVCWMNSLQKISRDANRPDWENVVDNIGYARNIEMAEEKT